jgi:hypothetical protein
MEKTGVAVTPPYAPLFGHEGVVTLMTTVEVTQENVSLGAKLLI